MTAAAELTLNIWFGAYPLVIIIFTLERFKLSLNFTYYKFFETAYPGGKIVISGYRVCMVTWRCASQRIISNKIQRELDSQLRYNAFLYLIKIYK